MTKAGTTLTISSLTLLAFLGVVAVKDIQYEREVDGHLQLAADANSTELATERLGKAIEGMEARGLCNEGGDNCFTSVLYRTPDEDVGFWRTNIEATYQDLQAMTPEARANHLVESNTLIKVRETLMDSSQGHERVTSPMGISLYPNNVFFAIWAWLSLITATISGFVVIHQRTRY